VPERRAIRTVPAVADLDRRRRRGRTVLALVLASLAVAACDGGRSSSAPDGGASPPTTKAPVADAPIPIDRAVHTTVLTNGLTVYVRENHRPGAQVQLRLVVDAGSLLEDPDQLGAAHFVEHMLFNGTEAYPRNELTHALERLGVEFGADLNASTSYDETVYHLQVQNDPELVATGLDVLEQWAAHATIAEADVEAERGVILEELRVRDLGAGGRAARASSDLLLAGTPAADRAPIGTADSIAQMDAARLRRFYDDWYRPDLMAVVVVGDIDADAVEQQVVERFSALSRPPTPRPRPADDAPVPVRTDARVLADPDATTGTVVVALPQTFGTPQTGDGQRWATAGGIALDVLGERLSDDATRGQAPFAWASTGVSSPTRSVGAVTVSVGGDPATAGADVRAVLTEIRRISRQGITQDELDRAVRARLAAAEQAYASDAGGLDVQRADAIVDHHLRGAPLTSAAETRRLTRRSLDGLTIDDVDAAFRAMVDRSAPRILVVGPAGTALPDAASLLALADGLGDLEVIDRPAEPATPDALMSAPAPVRVLSRIDVPELGAVQWLFSNGVLVRFTPTEVVDDRVVLDAARPGGTSRDEPDDVLAAEAGPSLVPRSGYGALDGVQVERVLADRSVGLTPWMDQARDGFAGSAATDDLEVLFQLVHQAMTAPRVDPAVFDAWRASVRPPVADQGSDPDWAVSIALAEAAYGDDPWYGSTWGWTLPRFDALTPDAVLAAWREHFGDARGFTFSFAGDASVEQIEDLSQRYLGSLPATDTPSKYVDRRPDRPSTIVRRPVQAGVDARATVAVEFSVGVERADAHARVDADFLRTILSTRLVDDVREVRGATSSPSGWVSVTDWPEPVVTTQVRVTCDPGRVEEVEAAVLGVLDDLRRVGPTAAEVDAARVQLVNDYGYISNESVAADTRFYAEHPLLDALDEGRRISWAQLMGPERLHHFVDDVLPASAYVVVEQTPKPAAGVAGG
jgi:zinc protease